MSKTARTDSFHILHTLVCCCFHLGIMALGLVRSTVELLTCGRGITPVRGFHKLTCPLLYRLALMLVFGLCVWKWTSSVTTLDPNQSCSVLQVVLLRAWRVQENLVNAEVQRDCAVLIHQKEQTCSFSSFWLGILK